MGKKNLGAWLVGIGIIMLFVAFFFYIFCDVIVSFGGAVICYMNIGIFFAILGFIYIVIGGLTWSKKEESL
ncbi:MAG: hypothetical protein ACFFD7_08175 [Candidatus Thorarchaeota archaeon]